MKSTLTILWFLIPCYLLFLSCTDKEAGPPCNQYVLLNNESTRPIWVTCTFDYPDTSMNFQSMPFNLNSMPIHAGYKGAVRWRDHECLEKAMAGTPAQKISIFIFDWATVNNVPWEQIRQNYQVLKRVDLTYQELVDNDFTITYK